MQTTCRGARSKSQLVCTRMLTAIDWLGEAVLKGAFILKDGLRYPLDHHIVLLRGQFSGHYQLSSSSCACRP
jgi:hypothetical protein